MRSYFYFYIKNLRNYWKTENIKIFILTDFFLVSLTAGTIENGFNSF